MDNGEETEYSTTETYVPPQDDIQQETIKNEIQEEGNEIDTQQQREKQNER